MLALDTDTLTTRQQGLIGRIRRMVVAAPEQFVTKMYSLEKAKKDFAALEKARVIEKYKSRWGTKIQYWTFVRVYDENGMRADR